MNVKFFGNSIDLFKYDILTFLSAQNSIQLFYIPMLTEKKERKIDPKYLSYNLGTKNVELYSFLSNCFLSDDVEFSEVSNVLEKSGIEYRVVLNSKSNSNRITKFEGIEHFSNENRELYFKNCCNSLEGLESNSLIFIDPCVGLDIGISRRFRSNKDAYLMLKELKLLWLCLKGEDVICFFQHLGNHYYSVEERMSDLKSEFGENLLTIGDKSILGSLVFIFKSKQQKTKYKNLLESYLNQYRTLKNQDKLILM